MIRKFALAEIKNPRVWHWWGFYDPQFGWFKFGAGYWLKRLVLG